MKILFITSGSIGDAIISTGILGHLIDAYPQARFTVAGGPAAIGMFAACPQVERLVTIRKLPWNKHWWNLWQEVRKEAWDMVVDLRGSLISFLLRTKKRYIFHKGNPALSKAQQLAAMMGLEAPPPTRLWSSGQAKKNAGLLLPRDRDIIVIAPKTNSAAKDWPIERFAELMRRIHKPDTQFVVLASAAQKPEVQLLISTDMAVLDLSGATDLDTAYAIMERASLFIGNDSGLLHMAAAAGIKCIGLYGPSNDRVYAPRGPHVTILKSHDFAMGEAEKRDNKYMQMISVDEVERVLLHG